MLCLDHIRDAKELLRLPFDEELPDISDVRLLARLNSLQVDIVRDTGYIVAYMDVPVAAGGALSGRPSTITRLLAAWRNGQPEAWTTAREQTGLISPWLSAGDANYLFTLGATGLSAYPSPSTTAQSYRLLGEVTPPVMVFDDASGVDGMTSYQSVFPEYDRDVLSYALAAWLAQRDDDPKAPRLQDQYAARLNAIHARLRAESSAGEGRAFDNRPWQLQG